MPQKVGDSVKGKEVSLKEDNILQKEAKRYESKGFGGAIALLQLVLFFYYGPELMKSLWTFVL